MPTNVTIVWNKNLHNSTTRRELGLLKHYSHLLFANIDDDVTPDGSCTGSFPIEKDWFGKDAITNLYRKQNYYRHSL